VYVVVMGLGQKFLTRVRSDIYGLGLNFENFPLKCQIFQFFSLRVKKNCFRLGRKVPGSKLGRPLIYCGSKVSSGQGPSLVCSKCSRMVTTSLGEAYTKTLAKPEDYVDSNKGKLL